METETSASTTATTLNLSMTPAAVISRWSYLVTQRYQHLLDTAVPHIRQRWISFLIVAFLYAFRVCLVQGFYVVTYALAIYILNLLIAFLSPQVDPSLSGPGADAEAEDGPSLPTHRSDEFRPFVRRLPEFKFWYSIMKAFVIAFFLTFFEELNVPVFWPILLFYWVLLFVLTMRKQIAHMVKYRYVPFTFGKQRYDGRRVPSTDDESS